MKNRRSPKATSRKNSRLSFSDKDAVVLLNPGDVTDFMPSGTDGLIAILEKREPLGEAGEKKAAFAKRILENKERIVVVEWLRDRQQAAGLEFKKG